jgi:hypothetical protein
VALTLSHRRRLASSTDSAQLCSPGTTSSGLQTRVFLSRTPPPSHSLLVATSSCLSPGFCFLDLFFFSTLIYLPYPVPSLVCFLTSHTRRWGREVKGQSSPQGQVGRGMPPESDSAVDSAQASAPRGRAHGLKPIGFQRKRAGRSSPDRAPRGGIARGSASVPSPRCCHQPGARSKLPRDAINVRASLLNFGTPLVP